MSQEASTQEYLDRHSGLVAGIVRSYLQTSEGRLQLAYSLIHPAQVLIDSLREGKFKPAASEVQIRIDDYKVFLRAVPEEEQVAEVYAEIKGNITTLEELLVQIS